MTKVLAALLGLALPRCAEPVVVVACAGDSITAGGHGAGHDYPSLLQDLLGDGDEVHNFGRSGTTVGDGDGFKPWRDSGGYDDMMETRFDVGIVSLGTNDAKESLWGAIEDDWVATYVDLIEELRSASPGAYFYVGATTPYLCCSGKWGDDTSVINEELPALERDVADAVGGSIMDFRSALGGDDVVEDYYDDKIHPNERGYAAMAAEAAATLLGGAVPEAESPGADAYDVDIDSPGDPPAPSPFPNIERALFPDDEEVKEDPYRPLVHGASDIDFDEHGDAVEFGRVSDGYEI
ncbi:methyltransferase domain-containing protein [Aureococcus anophagefferens]|nr:methyltransferase domain-containing protein [Aureococcus anophagefferens]